MARVPDGGAAGDYRIQSILRKDVLRRFGVRQDKLTDIFVKTGWRRELNEPAEVLLRFRGTGKGIPTLRGLLVSANVEEYIVLDRNGRHWAVMKEKWEIDPIVE